jgi:hypothetical protein
MSVLSWRREFMFAKKYEPMLFGVLLSGVMSLLVSGVSTLRALGMSSNFLSVWFSAWLAAWIIAFPAVLFAAPQVRRIVQRLIKQ